jgi:hypothetical protein
MIPKRQSEAASATSAEFVIDNLVRWDVVAEMQCALLSEKYGDRIDATLKSSMDNYRKTMTLRYQSDVAQTYRCSGRYVQYFAYLSGKPELIRRLLSRRFQYVLSGTSNR